LPLKIVSSASACSSEAASSTTMPRRRLPADVRRGEVAHHDVHAGKIDVVKVPLADAVHQQTVTLAVAACGRTVHCAGADLLAVAVTNVRAGELVTHRVLLPELHH